MIGRKLTIIGSTLLLLLVFAGTQAKADGVRFVFRGGPWSVHYHSGWHRFWGGPSIGFYYAPEPVYLVPGYDDYSYYYGPDFWYGNPSFGLSLDFGGGYYYGGGYRDRDFHRGDYHGDYHGGGYHGAPYAGGGYHSGNYGGGYHSGSYSGGYHSGSYHGAPFAGGGYHSSGFSGHGAPTGGRSFSGGGGYRGGGSGGYRGGGGGHRR